jgi:hypothetical protein
VRIFAFLVPVFCCHSSGRASLRFLFVFALVLITTPLFAQQGSLDSLQTVAASRAASEPEKDSSEAPAQAHSDSANLPEAPSISTSQSEIPLSKQQPKSILGMMPDFRAASAGATPPPTPKQAFKTATQNSFDYSSFISVGITSLWTESSKAHPALGKGVSGYGRYYWRGFLDKTDGKYLTTFAFPAVFHEDVRYFAMGESALWKRGIYAGSRILITPDYQGRQTVNASELLGRGAAQAISLFYYPSKDRTAGQFAQRYGFALGSDALTNIFREFWPDIAAHVLHRSYLARARERVLAGRAVALANEPAIGVAGLLSPAAVTEEERPGGR